MTALIFVRLRKCDEEENKKNTLYVIMEGLAFIQMTILRVMLFLKRITPHFTPMETNILMPSDLNGPTIILFDSKITDFFVYLLKLGFSFCIHLTCIEEL